MLADTRSSVLTTPKLPQNKPEFKSIMKKTKIFAVSDIHGHATLLKSALESSGFEKNNAEHLLVVCGDCFDRGRENRAVLRFLNGVKNKVIVRGNHEDKLIQLLDRLQINDVDRHNGTDITVREFFGADEVTDDGRLYPDPYTEQMLRDFVRQTVDYFETESYIFTHGFLPLHRDRTPPTLNESWRHAPDREWPYARFTGWQEVYPLRLVPEGKTVVCGHRSASYAADFDPSRATDDFSVFSGNGIIAIDACTVLSGRVNVLVVEDSVATPTEHCMRLRDVYFDAIARREKQVEMRLFDEKRRDIKMGDEIIFMRDEDNGDRLRARVTGLYRYDDFHALARDFSPEILGFPGKSSAYIGGFMESIYSQEQIGQHGALAISLCLI